MKAVLPLLILAALIFPGKSEAQFESARDSVVQLYGIVMTADSLEGIPAVSITIRGTNRGTVSNAEGVFSIVVLKGDVVEFTHVSFMPKIVTIPRELTGTQHSIVQLMVADNDYLPVTVIKPRPTPEQFARDFVNLDIPDDDLEIARQNNDAAKRRILARTLPADGREATSIQFRDIANKAVYRGQIPPQNIFNPIAWMEFVNAWKRGDFKNKRD